MATSWKWNATYDLWYHPTNPLTGVPAVSGGRVKQLKPLFPYHAAELRDWWAAAPGSAIYRFILSGDFPIIRDSGILDATNRTGILTVSGLTPVNNWYNIVFSQRVFNTPGNTLDYTIVFCMMESPIGGNTPIT